MVKLHCVHLPDSDLELSNAAAGSLHESLPNGWLGAERPALAPTMSARAFTPARSSGLFAGPG